MANSVREWEFKSPSDGAPPTDMVLRNPRRLRFRPASSRRVGPIVTLYGFLLAPDQVEGGNAVYRCVVRARIPEEAIIELGEVFDVFLKAFRVYKSRHDAQEIIFPILGELDERRMTRKGKLRVRRYPIDVAAPRPVDDDDLVDLMGKLAVRRKHAAEPDAQFEYEEPVHKWSRSN